MIRDSQDHKDFMNNIHENQRTGRVVSSIYTLASVQSESNRILEKQCDELQKRNTMLEEELNSGSY